MKSALAAVALVVVANGMVLVSAGRERAAPASLHHDRRLRRAPDRRRVFRSGARRFQLSLAPDSSSTPPGLDTAGLRALGFAEAMIAGHRQAARLDLPLASGAACMGSAPPTP